MPAFYNQDGGSSVSFYTARRSFRSNPVSNPEASRSSLQLAANMMEPLVRLRTRRSTRQDGGDEWFIPYQQPSTLSPPSSYLDSGIGSSPHASLSKGNGLLSYFQSSTSPTTGNFPPDFNKTYRFPGVSDPRNSSTTAFPSRPFIATLQPPSRDSLLDVNPTGLRLPTDQSVPTGLNAPKLLFSPLNREVRTGSNPMPDFGVSGASEGTPQSSYVAPGRSGEEHGGRARMEVRARTISAPARQHRKAHIADAPEPKHWQAATICDRLVFPRPSITPHVITPPDSPEQNVNLGAMGLDRSIMEDGKARAREREDWADYVKQRGRSMSYGEQGPTAGKPIIGNNRARTKEHARRESMQKDKDDRTERNRNSGSSMWNRRGSGPNQSTDDTNRPNLLHVASDESVGVSRSFGFLHPRRNSLPRARAPRHAQAGPSDDIANQDFYPRRQPSQRYRGLRARAFSQSSPDLSRSSREASEEYPPMPSMPPVAGSSRGQAPRVLRIQDNSPRRGSGASTSAASAGVVVIGPGQSAYRAPAIAPPRRSSLSASSTGTPDPGRSSSLRQRRPAQPSNPRSAAIGRGNTSASSTTNRRRPQPLDLSKPLPQIPRGSPSRGDRSPTIELPPFTDLTVEVGRAMSPEMRSITGFPDYVSAYPALSARRPSPVKDTVSPQAVKPGHAASRSLPLTSPPPHPTESESVAARTISQGMTSPSSPSMTRALLARQHQLAKQKRAFQSPTKRQSSASVSRGSTIRSTTSADHSSSQDHSSSLMQSISTVPRDVTAPVHSRPNESISSRALTSSTSSQTPRVGSNETPHMSTASSDATITALAGTMGGAALSTIPISLQTGRRQTALEQAIGRRRGSVDISEHGSSSRSGSVKHSPEEQTPNPGRFDQKASDLPATGLGLGSSPILPSLVYPISTLASSSYTASRPVAPQPRSLAPPSTSSEDIARLPTPDLSQFPPPPPEMPQAPPPMLRTETSTTQMSKTTVYTSASEGWSRSGLDTGMTTPTPQAGREETGSVEMGRRGSLATDTPSPPHIFDDKDFAVSFFSPGFSPRS